MKHGFTGSIIALGGACCSFGISSLALLGYALRLAHLYNWNGAGGTIAMALPTAVAIWVVSASVIVLAAQAIEATQRATGAIDRRALVAVSVLALLVCGGAWYSAQKASAAANREKHLAVMERAQAAHEYAEAVTIRNQAKLAALNQRRHFENSWARWGHVRTFVMAFMPGGES